MITTVQKWGNSLGVRIPKPLAEDTRLHEGSQVDVREEDDRLIIVPVEQPVFRLENLLKRVSKKNLHREVDFGAPEGKEAW
jgi:antitoxin MazE